MSWSRVLKAGTASNGNCAPLSFRALHVVRGAEGEGTIGEESRPDPEAVALEEEVVRRSYEEGFRAGREVGVRSGEEQVRPLVEQFGAAVAELDGWRARLFRRSERQALELVMQVAEVVLRRELEIHPEALLPMIRHGLDLIDSEDRITVHLHPQVFEALEQAPDALSREYPNVDISIDPDVGEDGFRVETQLGEIRANLTQQLTEIGRRFDLTPEGLDS